MGAISRNKFLKDFSEAVIEGHAAVFAGAGFSASAGFVDWKGLIRDLAGEIGLNVDKEYDLVSLAQYYENEHNRQDITKAIFDNFTRKAKLDENHLLLASLPINTYWTTNFDSLLEDALRKCGKKVDVKSQIGDFRNVLKGRNATVYKMHGDINHPDNTILLKREFEDYASTHTVFHNALMSDMMDKTFLFIGFSFTDPNLNYVLSRLRFSLDGTKIHYNITKAVNQKEYAKPEEFQYDEIKQKHFINDLDKNYHIQTVLVEDWGQITDVLREVKKRNDRQTIYISGAAEEYSIWEEETCKTFIRELSAKLIRLGYKLVTGYGLGVGSLVIAGALEEIYKDTDGVVDNQIIMRPFPVGYDKDKIDTNRYRRDMITNTGITIFLFGNKKNIDKIVLSDDMNQEYSWSKDQNNLLIPVGATGYKAKQYYDELMASFPSEEYNKYKNELEIIGDSRKSPAELIAAVLNIINMANH